MKAHTLHIMRSKAGHYWVTLRSVKYPGIREREMFGELFQAHDALPRMIRELDIAIQGRDDQPGFQRICEEVARLEKAEAEQNAALAAAA